jgi:HNH endonuclease.
MFLWDTVRSKVLERDDHTCQRCGLSEEMWWRAYHQVQELINDRARPVKKADGVDAWRERKRELREAYDVDSPKGGLHIDHIEPLSEEGHPLDTANLQTLCKYCHYEKTHEDAELEQTERIPISEFVDWA